MKDETRYKVEKALNKVWEAFKVYFMSVLKGAGYTVGFFMALKLLGAY